jgi:hypothetical protein
MVALYLLMGLLFTAYASVALWNAYLDWRWRKVFKDVYKQEWRKVPPPNWASSRGGRDYW